MIQGHGGNIYALARWLGCKPEAIIDVSSNINPLGAPPGLLAHLREHLECIGILPEVDARRSIRHMAALLGVDPRRMLAGCGTTQFIYAVCPALNAQKVLIVGPTYADYADACLMHAVQPRHFLAHADQSFEVDLALLDQALEDVDTVFICNPNNPTGRLIPCEDLETLCRAHPRTYFIVDESYLPFVPAHESRSIAGSELDNVVVLWSLSKIFGLPGLRAGFLITNGDARSRFTRLMQPWNLNSPAQAAIDYLGDNQTEMREFIDKTCRFLSIARRQFCEQLASERRLQPYPSRTTYLLIGLPDGFEADAIYRYMAHRRLLIRPCGNFLGLSNAYIRIALKDAQVNQIAVDLLLAAVQHSGTLE